MTYFVADGILLLTFLVCIILVDFESTDEDAKDLQVQEPLLKALPKLFTVPFLVLIFGVFVTGLQWGIHDSFLFLYLQEDLKADSKLLSYMAVIGMASQVRFSGT